MIQNKPMGEILKRMELMEFLEIIIFDETMILNDPIDTWPICDCLISFHSKGWFNFIDFIGYKNRGLRIRSIGIVHVYDSL